MVLFALLSQLFAFDPAALPPLKLPSKEEIASVPYDAFESSNHRILIPKLPSSEILWSIDDGQSYLKLNTSYDQVTKQWVISSWDRRKEVRVTMGNNILIFVSGPRTLRFTRFQIPDTPINIPETKGILNPSFQLYVFDCEKDERLRVLVENPFIGTPRSGSQKTSVRIMTADGLIYSTEVLNKETDVEGALVSISSKAGFLNIPTGRDLPEVNIPRTGSSDGKGSSVSFNLSASDGSATSGSPRALAGSGEFSSPTSGSPRSTTVPAVSALAHGHDRFGNLSPRRSPRTPRDYQNLMFWRPTAHPGTPAVYYFGRQASRDEEIAFINQLVGHLTDEANVRFERYLGPWDLFVP
jgi:hypothetical protein